jgi:hypothetical protein
MHLAHDTFGFLDEHAAVEFPNQNYGEIGDCSEGKNS